MRVIVMGGAGHVGSEVVKDLANYTNDCEIVIADRDQQTGIKLAAEIGNQRVSFFKIDARSGQDLVCLFKGSTVVAGALGPFYRYEKQIVEAALEAGVNYVSICNDHDATAAVLGLDEKARNLGRRILIGLGWSPGLGNLLTKKAWAFIEKPESVNIFCAGSAGDQKGFASLLHTLHAFSGTALPYKNQAYVSEKSGSHKEEIRFPMPLGEVNSFYLRHPETLTTPLHLAGLKEVTYKGGLNENYLNNLARFFSIMGLTGSVFSKQLLGRFLKNLLYILPIDKRRVVSGIRVDVSGMQYGHPFKICFAAVDHHKRLAGIPLSIGTIMMMNNQIHRFGVFSPEASNAVNVDTFFSEIEKRGVIIFQQEQD